MRSAQPVVVFGAIIALTALASLAAPAFDGHLTKEVCFSSSDAGLVPRDTLSRAVEIQNQGSTTLWCALTNQADALVNHCRQVTVGSTWAIDGSPNNAVWCIAGGGVDQQTSLDGGANGTADGGPAGCTIISNAH